MKITDIRRFKYDSTLDGTVSIHTVLDNLEDIRDSLDYTNETDIYAQRLLELRERKKGNNPGRDIRNRKRGRFEKPKIVSIVERERAHIRRLIVSPFESDRRMPSYSYVPTPKKEKVIPKKKIINKPEPIKTPVETFQAWKSFRQSFEQESNKEILDLITEGNPDIAKVLSTVAGIVPETPPSNKYLSKFLEPITGILNNDITENAISSINKSAGDIGELLGAFKGTTIAKTIATDYKKTHIGNAARMIAIGGIPMLVGGYQFVTSDTIGGRIGGISLALADPIGSYAAESLYKYALENSEWSRRKMSNFLQWGATQMEPGENTISKSIHYATRKLGFHEINMTNAGISVPESYENLVRTETRGIIKEGITVNAEEVLEQGLNNVRTTLAGEAKSVARDLVNKDLYKEALNSGMIKSLKPVAGAVGSMIMAPLLYFAGTAIGRMIDGPQKNHSSAGRKHIKASPNPANTKITVHYKDGRLDLEKLDETFYRQYKYGIA